MNSKIYFARLAHTRHEPVHRTFIYPAVYVSLDLDELPDLARRSAWFGWNTLRAYSIRSRDYLSGSAGDLKAKFLDCLAEQGFDQPVQRAFLVTMPRYLGYAFNPVSFWFGYSPDGGLAACLAEVNNTFSERHLYLMRPNRAVESQDRWIGSSTKEFHVSPFFDRTGEYRFILRDPRETLDVRIDLVREGRRALTAKLWGEGLDLTPSNLRKAMLKYPLTLFQTTPRILIQAGQLFYRNRLRLYSKPDPVSEKTFSTARLTIRESIGRRFLRRYLAGLREGCLRVVHPDRSDEWFGDRSSPLRAEVHVKRGRFFWRVFIGGDVGFGESYTDGDWTSPNLNALFDLLVANRDGMNDYNIGPAWISRFRDRLSHAARRNSDRRTRKNIGDHYDLGNDLFKLFLDHSLTYSCGIYRRPADSLEQAQANKIDAMIQKADIRAGSKVLEIGSGWGALAIEAVRRTGCDLTTATLSEQQLAHVRRRVEEEDLSEKIHPILCDYRHLQGTFDRIVSVEMFEAVGKEYFDKFFATCDRLLRPGGVMAMQVITLAENRYEAYAKGCDWIQKHIFPGGFLPALSVLCEASEKFSSLKMVEDEEIGPHYARTLREWAARFRANRTRILQKGYSEEFCRKWDYYFAYCEAGFVSGDLLTYQLVFRKEPERTT